jgi:hypothetical protein
MTVTVRNLTDTDFAAEVSGVTLDDVQLEGVRRRLQYLWTKHQVLVFHGLDTDNEPKLADLSRVFGDPRVVRQFETLQEQVATTSDTTTAAVAETGALKDAAFVTLSANAELPNERVLAVGAGMALDTATPGLVRLISNVFSDNGWPVELVASGATSLGLPTVGILATRAGAETLSNKTLAEPKLSGLVDAADDAAAATAGVPVGGIYRTGSALKVRVS